MDPESQAELLTLRASPRERNKERLLSLLFWMDDFLLISNIKDKGCEIHKVLVEKSVKYVTVV